MGAVSYSVRREELLAYFDRHAALTWARLTSEAPVSRIRATVRKGRDEMRARLLSWLPIDLAGARVLDAGCGTGAMAVELARRGAHVTAVDLSPTLIGLARERTPSGLGVGRIDFVVGDLLDPALGSFDHVVAMDSLIHYEPADMARMVAGLTARAKRSVVFTVAPRTKALVAMHTVGKIFPRRDRAPAIRPIAVPTLHALARREADFAGWRFTQDHRVSSGFYVSQAVEARPE